jgi:pimeloyl-ACP methyl ester carboxylesterase
MLNRHCAGVVTLSTQSAGCEQVDQLGDDVPVLLFHGTDDELLPAAVSEMVQMLLGHGELVLLPGNGHLLSDAGDLLRERLLDWIPARFADHAARDDHAGDAASSD